MNNEENILPAKYDNKAVVVQHNNLLEAPKNLTLQEYKLFMFLISKINPDDGLSAFRVTASEFAKVIGINNSTYIYRDLQTVTKRLMERVVKIQKPESKVTIQTHLISSMYYWYGEGYVDIKISPEMAPYLFGLKRDFTQYKLSQITTLSSIYAIRIYELLKKREKFGSRVFFLDKLKEKLNILPDKLKAFKDFRLYVLEIAKREINEKTDMVIDFKFQKSGRKIVAVEFDIKPKNQKRAENQHKVLELYNHSYRSKYVDEIMQYGFKRTSVNRMLSELEDHQIENALLAVKEQIQNGKCKTPKAMLRIALKERWTPSRPSMKTQHKISAISIDQVCENSLPPKTEEKIQSGPQKKTGFFTFLNKMLNK